MDKEQLIANYFSNCLSEEEKEQFQYLLNIDTEFKTKVDFETRVKHAIHKKEHQNLKEHFKNLDDSILIERQTPNRKIWLVAASITLLVALTFSYIYFNKDYSSEELYANYYQPAKNVVHPIVRNNDSQTDKNKAFIAYQKEDYVTAEKLFSSLYMSTKNSELLFYEGITLLELNKVDGAILKFKSHLNYSDAVSEMTNWYLALAYLKQNDIQNTKTILTEIVNNEALNYKKEDAKTLLKKL